LEVHHLLIFGPLAQIIVIIPLYYLNPPSELKFNESIGTRVLRFSYNSIVKTHIPAYYAYFNFQNKSIKLLLNASIKFVISGYSFFFVGTCENPIMADDAITFSNPFLTPMQDEELEKTFINVNVF